jgi:hypothetical protein
MPTSRADTTAGLSAIAIEGASDFFFGRPFDANPYSRSEAEPAWESWRFGWLEASWSNEMRGTVERRRWRTAA